MPACQRLIALGDLALTLPAAAALVAALLAARAWRIAFWWSLLFGVATGLVGASKIAFMGWGGGWPAACFKALSGHAAVVSALFPMLFYLLLQRLGRRAALAGLAGGIALGALVALWLVLLREHSGAEALAGWCLGAAVSPLALRLAGPFPPPAAWPGAAAFVLVFAAGSWLMQWAPVGYWMIVAARILSGNQQIFPLDSS